MRIFHKLTVLPAPLTPLIRKIPMTKDDLRRHMKQVRGDLFPGDHAQKTAALFMESFFPLPSTHVALYYSRGSELSTTPLADLLLKKGHTLALPALKDGTLVFRPWDLDEPLVPDEANIPAPSGSETCLPSVIVTPLLAFDRKGGRLGSGRGHYDRALATLRALQDITVIGYAYPQQEVDEVPQDDYDQKLDFIITSEQLIKV